MKGRHQRRRPSKTTTTKRIVWACLINGIGWVWCSYALAFLGRTEIAESLSRTAVTEIIGVVLLYCVKSLFEAGELRRYRQEGRTGNGLMKGARP